MQALEAGQRFGRYRIQSRLSGGISGMSYEAEDTLLQRKVTLKLIHPWAALSDAARRQFFREMQGISALTHPYLATILDYGEVDGQIYVVRRYVTPGSLLGSEGRYWFHAPLNVIDAVYYTRQLAEALQHVHSNGYLHGAVTFSNILVLRGMDTNKDSDFAPFLLVDIGTTHFVRRFGQLQTALLPITAAPEQFGKRVIAASDQYALAVILYFWLTGRPPFLGTPEEIELLKLSETIMALTTQNSRVPLELEGVIRRALSVYPEERYPSITAFANALQASTAHLIPIVSPPVSNEPQIEVVQVEEIEIRSSMHDEPAPSNEEVHRQNGQFPDHGASDEYRRETNTTFQDNSLSTLELLATGIAQPDQAAKPPEPLPQVVPDVPQTLPQPAPEPLPEPTPQEPESESAPELDTILVPEPDIPQPIPEPKPIPPIEPAKNTGSPRYQDTARQLQASVIITSAYTEQPQEIILEREETTLGHAGSSDILLDKGTLTSRRHALLKRKDNRYFIYDQCSANGVALNGQKIASEMGHELQDGDHISIGEYELVFQIRHLDEWSEKALYQAR